MQCQHGSQLSRLQFKLRRVLDCLKHMQHPYIVEAHGNDHIK